MTFPEAVFEEEEQKPGNEMVKHLEEDAPPVPKKA
jgi:hypothetical protein